jgi:hypothetical protein
MLLLLRRGVGRLLGGDHLGESERGEKQKENKALHRLE